MSRPPRLEFENALYHVTSRGNAQQVIFHTDKDRQHFLEQLQDNLESYGVVLNAYVLMSNHYHLLLRTPKANLSRFMQRLNTSYSLYARYKHKKAGHLFQGRFKAKMVEDEGYLLVLSRYIHLNPIKIKSGVEKTPRERILSLEEYVWSSYRGYVGTKYAQPWIDYTILKKYGRTMTEARRRYRAYTHAMVTKNDEPILEALRAGGLAIGGIEFKNWTQRQLQTKYKENTRQDVLLASKVVPLEKIDQGVAEHFGISKKVLQEHGHKAGMAKAVAVELAVQLSGKTMRQIGLYYGDISGQAVYMLRGRLKKIQNSRDVLAEVGKRLESV